MHFKHMSCDLIFPIMWYVRPPKAQTSLHIQAIHCAPTTYVNSMSVFAVNFFSQTSTIFLYFSVMSM